MAMKINSRKRKKSLKIFHIKGHFKSNVKSYTEGSGTPEKSSSRQSERIKGVRRRKKEWRTGNLKEAHSRKRKLTSFDIWFHRMLKRCLSQPPAHRMNVFHQKNWEKERVYRSICNFEKFLKIVFKQKRAGAWKLKIIPARPT